MNEVVEHLRDALVANHAADRAGDRTAHAQRQHVAQRRRVHGLEDIHGVADVFDRAPEEEAVGDVVEMGRQALEFAVAVAEPLLAGERLGRVRPSRRRFRRGRAIRPR